VCGRVPQSCVATVRDDVELSFVVAQATRKTVITTVALEGISDLDYKSLILSQAQSRQAR
jgi:hypothetical protein